VSIVKTSLTKNGFVEIESRGHKVISDTPIHRGGTDKGLFPGELLLGALGACQTLSAKALAKKFDIDLQNFWVELEGDRGQDEQSAVPRIQDIKFIFHIETDAPNEKIEEFTNYIETHCPIAETLANIVNLISSKVVVEKQAN